MFSHSFKQLKTLESRNQLLPVGNEKRRQKGLRLEEGRKK